MSDYLTNISKIYNRLYGSKTATELKVEELPDTRNYITIEMDLDRALDDPDTLIKSFSRTKCADMINKVISYLKDANFFIKSKDIMFRFKNGNTLNELNNVISDSFYRSAAELRVKEYELRMLLHKIAPEHINGKDPLYHSGQDPDLSGGLRGDQAKRVMGTMEKFCYDNNLSNYFYSWVGEIKDAGMVRYISYDIESYYTDTENDLDINVYLENPLKTKYSHPHDLYKLMEKKIYKDFPKINKVNISIAVR